MKCPNCGVDLTKDIASHLGKLGGVAAAAALTKRQRIAKARKAGEANAGVPKAPSLTRGEAMKAAWDRGDFEGRKKKRRRK